MNKNKRIQWMLESEVWGPDGWVLCDSEEEAEELKSSHEEDKPGIYNPYDSPITITKIVWERQ